MARRRMARAGGLRRRMARARAEYTVLADRRSVRQIGDVSNVLILLHEGLDFRRNRAAEPFVVAGGGGIVGGRWVGLGERRRG